MNWIVIVSLALPIITLAIYVINLRLKVRELSIKVEERTSLYRQELYSRQLDGFFELNEVMRQVALSAFKITIYYKKEKDEVFKFSELRDEVKSPSDHTQVGKYKQEYIECYNNFIEKLLHWQIILPKELVDSLEEFQTNLDPEKLNYKQILKSRGYFFKVAYDKLGITLIEDTEKYFKKV